MIETKKRYEFTGETKTMPRGVVVRQIRRLKDGAIGGWIQYEENLRHEGWGWLEPDAIAMGEVDICGGTFKGGEFWGGTFKGGTFWGGTFWGGTFWGGTFWGGTFEGGTFEGGTFWGGTFKGGTFLGGTFRGGTFKGGTFWGGEFRGGTFLGGTFLGGTFRGGTFKGGTFWGGEFEGGTYKALADFLVVTGLRFQVTIQSDGRASIGCTIKPIREWLALTFEDQTDITDRAEFEQAARLLRPLFEAFAEPKYVDAGQGDE